MTNDFEKLREELYEAIDVYGLNSEKTKEISKKYNDLVNGYYENEEQPHELNIMNSKYLESMKCLKEMTKELTRFPSIKEWNHYAKEKDLLNSESLKYMNGNDWKKLKDIILEKS